MCAPDTAVPFFHLKSDGFWHLHANEGYESKLSRARKLRAVSRIHELISHVTLDDELFVLLADAGNREIIRQTLICTYFSNFQDEFGRLITEGQEIWTYTELLLTGNNHSISRRQQGRQKCYRLGRSPVVRRG